MILINGNTNTVDINHTFQATMNVAHRGGSVTLATPVQDLSWKTQSVAMAA